MAAQGTTRYRLRFRRWIMIGMLAAPAATANVVNNPVMMGKGIAKPNQVPFRRFLTSFGLVCFPNKPKVPRRGSCPFPRGRNRCSALGSPAATPIEKYWVLLDNVA